MKLVDNNYNHSLLRSTVERVRIIHPHDIFKGQIGYILERIDQHSLYTYVIIFRGGQKRAYQRNEIKFLKSVKASL